MLGAALAYLVSPIQILPNIIPVIGQTDDVLVLMAALRYTARHVPRTEVEAAWPGDPCCLDRLLGNRLVRQRHSTAPASFAESLDT